MYCTCLFHLVYIYTSIPAHTALFSPDNPTPHSCTNNLKQVVLQLAAVYGFFEPAYAGRIFDDR